MRTRVLLAMVTLLVAVPLAACQGLPGAPVAAQGSADGAVERTIDVSGEAEVRVVPDEVILTLGVETYRSQLAASKAANDAVVERLLEMCEAQGIDARYVKTGYISVEPRYVDSYVPERRVVGYVARKTITITLRDVSQFEALLSQALESGVNHVHGVEFRTTELRRYRDEARALAIRAAQEKAAALAGELGRSIGEPRAIREQYSGWYSGYGAWWGTYGYGSMTQNVVQQSGTGTYEYDGAVAPGEIAVSARVGVTFDLQ